MAMLTTRNIEYIVLSSACVTYKVTADQKLGFWTTAIVLSLLFASDKLSCFLLSAAP